MEEKGGIIYLGYNNPFIHKRGVENVIFFQSQALEKNVDKFYIFFGEKDGEFKWEDIKCISIKKDIFRFMKLNKIIKKLNKNNFFLIHSHNYLMSFFLLKKTDVFTVHDGLYYLSSKINHRYKRIFKYIEKIVYKKSKFVHFISEFSKKKSLYKGNNFQIIFNTTPLEKINENKNVFWESDKIKIFSVRSIEDRANIDILIDLASRNKKYEIKIAGKGPLIEKYKNEIENKKYENIRLIGYISDEDIRKYYRECDIVVVLAKYGEGFGLPIIEGYLHDKPVFGSNICAIPEIILNKGEFLVENNVESLEKKINDYFSKENNYKYKLYYDENFSYDKIIKKYKKMYKYINDMK